MKITGGNYRDETRIVHMLQALERLELESAGVATVDELSSNEPDRFRMTSIRNLK